ncbi:MAG: phosphatidylglycerophosphatase A [Fuerstiella sp.]
MSVLDRIVLFLAEGAGLGRLKQAPGTWGSLWGLPLGWAFGQWQLDPWQKLLIALGMFIVGVPLCGRAADLRQRKDPGSVVWDEIAAFPIVFAFAPATALNVWWVLLAGFGLFRLFDIWKPPPVRQCDRITGGLGIMIDDTVAAVYAAFFLWAFLKMAG